LLCLPLSGFAVIYGNEIILLLFGEKWTDVAAPFKILVGALYFRLSYRVTESVAFSKDALAGTALRQTIYGIAVIVGSIVGSRWGVTGIATGVTIALGIFFVLSATFANQLSQTSLKQFARAHASAVFITLVVVISLATLKTFVLTRFGVVSSLLAAMIAFMTICSALVLCGPSFLFRESVLDPMRSSLKMWLRPRVRRRL
jgi:O-antigen/teichoic acid export membrane protein